MVGRDALAADAARHRHELQIEIFDAELVDLLAHLGDQFLSPRRVDKGFDVRRLLAGAPARPFAIALRRLHTLFHDRNSS
jgi:hypothetical protein